MLHIILSSDDPQRNTTPACLKLEPTARMVKAANTPPLAERG
jgi:hypothetical protein